LRTVGAQALTLASANRLDLVAQTLDDVQQRETRTFFETHLPLLQHCVQNQYPLDADMLATYALRWDWRRLSASAAIPWSLDLLSQFEDCWDWDSLSKNRYLPWSGALLQAFVRRWNWGLLSGNPALPWSLELLETFAPLWDELERRAALESDADDAFCRALGLDRLERKPRPAAGRRHGG